MPRCADTNGQYTIVTLEKCRGTGLGSNPDLSKLWIGQAISQIGSNITGVGGPLTAVLVLKASTLQMGFLSGAGAAAVTYIWPLRGSLGGPSASTANPVARVNANGSGRPGEPLERVATLAREVVDSMGDIVWSTRSESHGMESLIRRMREFALDLLSSQGIDFELRTPEMGKPAELSLQARRQVFLIFKKCIHNAARHSRCSAVVAELKIADREAVMTIEDNGTGLRSEDKTTGGTGISNIERRSWELGGRMQIDFEAGRGLLRVDSVSTRAQPAEQGDTLIVTRAFVQVASGRLCITLNRSG
jgi:two-component sensor histidine kinase